MFQADYFLKELALGEYTMPIVGMLSVFDWSEVLEMHHQWTGREWFVVKKAEVRLAEDKTLIPFVKMGVEAREQVLTAEGLRDAPITSANHPLRRFADAFTRNFDLIAERKSVVFHLRELAKASVVAKFLVDSGAKLDQGWFDLADEIVEKKVPEAFPEIPQLWNMRGLSRIRLEDGKVVDTETGLVTNLHAIYGGVEFGLDRFELAQRTRPGIPVPGMAMQQAPLQAALQGMQLGPSGRPMFMPQRFQLSQRGEMPQGVDLNLDQFNLTEVEQFGAVLPACSGDSASLEARVRLGRAFLAGLRAGGEDENQKLLASIFNPALADRTQEAEAFVPPDPNHAYVAKLRSLVGEEQALFKKRKGAFCDKSFTPGTCGPEFPRSWASRFTTENGLSPQVLMKIRSALVQLQVDATFQQSLLEDVLPVAAPEFHKTTEDGVDFRIYRLGSLEVRTIQEPDSTESIAVVFSARAPSWGLSPQKAMQQAPDHEKICRGRLYLEAIDAESARRLDAKWSSKRSDYCHYYVVLETEGNNMLVTEKLADGSTFIVMNPDSIEDRNSMAKLVATADDCAELNIDLAKIKQIQINNNKKLPEGACPSLRKNYAKSVFAMVRRKVQRQEKARWSPTQGSERRPYTSRKPLKAKEEPVAKPQQESC